MVRYGDNFGETVSILFEIVEIVFQFSIKDTFFLMFYDDFNLNIFQLYCSPYTKHEKIIVSNNPKISYFGP